MYGSASAAPAPSPPPDGASAPARDDPTAETLAASAPPRDVVASLVRSGAAPGRGGTSPPAHLAASPASHPRRDPVSPAALAALDAAAGVVSAAAESHRAASSSSSSRLSHGASAHHRHEPPHPSSPPRAFADAMWASAEDAVDAVARAVAADGAGEDPDPRARELVARAAAAHALHAAEVARFAAAGAASAARDARRANASARDPGADADAERAAALADQAAEAATRAAARVKTLHNVRGVPAEDVSRVKSLDVRGGDDVERRRGAASRAAAFDAFDAFDASRAARRLAKHAEVLRRGEAAAFDPASGGALPPTPEAVRRRALARSPRVDAVAAARDARARGEALRLAAEANETRPAAEYSPIPRSPATTTPLGAPRRVPMTPEDARAYDEAEARVRRREAAAREAEEAVARALEAAGARGARGQRGELAKDSSAAAAARGGRLVVPPPPNTAAAIAARARASLEWSSSRPPEGAGGARSDPPSAQTSPATLDGASRGAQKTLPARDEKRVDAGDDESNRKRRGPFATKKKDRVASRRDPLSFSTPFISNAHTRFHGEISAADKRLFFSEGNKGSEDEDEEGFRDAPGSDSDSPRRKPGSRVDDDAPSSRDWIARGLPRPTKKSEASAAEARRRAAETARRRAAARAEKSGASFGGEKTKKGASLGGRNRVPRVEEKDEKEGFARSPDHPIPIRDGTSSGGASEADASSRRGYRYPSRVYPPSYAEARLDAARSLLADLDTGAPLTPEDASLLELERRSSGAIARVRAYRSAVESPPGVRRGRGEAVPAHERYEHYKMRGFGGMGAKTSWAK